MNSGDDHADPRALRRRTRLAALTTLACSILLAAACTFNARVDSPPVAGQGIVQGMAQVDPGTVHDADWFDPVRRRAVPVRLYWPQGIAADARVPLVVFSHGLGGSRRGYSYLGAHFAANGIASLHLQHVGSDRSLWGGSLFSLVERLQGAAQDTEAIARVHDLRFALDHLLAGPRGEQIDRSRIVAAGHSYGANTALLAAGARVEREGRWLDYRDARISAAIVISAPPFYGERDPAKVLSHVSIPTLHITATEDVIRVPGYYSPAADRLAVFAATGSARKTLAVFDGGSHSMFTDRTGTGGANLNPQVKRATQDLSVAFLKMLFEGHSDTLASWPLRHPGIVARFNVAG